MFAPPPVVATEVFARLPDALRIPGETAWTRARGSGPLHSFLEGPAFDRAGRLYCVDINHGRIFRVSTAGDWSVFAHYDGNPNGLAIHRDGRVFVADQTRGLLCFDAATGAITEEWRAVDGVPLRAPNDLTFADNGDLYFTDPGESGLEDPHGRVYRMRSNGRFDLLLADLPYPNGLVLDPRQTVLFVAMSRTLQVLRLPLRESGVFKVGVFLQLSGGLAGPDGMAIATDGSLAIAHSGLGVVWLMSPLGEPLARVQSCAGIRTTNVAFGGPGERSLYITEAEAGVILRAPSPVAGRSLFSHA
jgi:gluconolactonase